jgi:hypothetical protein
MNLKPFCARGSAGHDVATSEAFFSNSAKSDFGAGGKDVHPFRDSNPPVGGEFRKYREFLKLLSFDISLSMRDIFTLFLHAMVIIIRLARPGGLRSVVAESVLLPHQVLILNRGRKRAANLRLAGRVIAGLCTLLMHQPGWFEAMADRRTRNGCIFTRC